MPAAVLDAADGGVDEGAAAAGSEPARAAEPGAGVDEGAAAAGSEPARAAEPGAAEVHAAAPSPAGAERIVAQPPPVAPPESVAPAVEAPPSAARRSADDAIDSSSVSSEFFRGDEDSVPPLVDAVDREPHDEPAPESEIHPATLARRARLRRIVGAVIGVAGAVTLAAVGKSLISSKPVHQAPQPVAMTLAPAPPKDAQPEAKAAPEAKPASGAKAADGPETKAADAPEAKATDVRTAEPKIEEKAPDPADAAKLKKDALNYLNRGRYKEAIETARGAIAADPSDAMAYLYLGSALQDSGKWKDGIAAYSDCVRNAKKGPIHECAAMGGRK